MKYIIEKENGTIKTVTIENDKGKMELSIQEARETKAMLDGILGECQAISVPSVFPIGITPQPVDPYTVPNVWYYTGCDTLNPEGEYCI